jgi:signal transduction histidine kinase
MSALQERVTALERSAAQHDKQIKAIRELIHEGMRLMIETRKDLRTLAAAQKRTDAALRAYIERAGTQNGHTKRKIDLQ